MKKLSNKILLAVFAALMISGPAKADHLGSDYNQFAKLIREAQSNGTIQNDFEVRVLFSADAPSSSELNGDLISNLKEIAANQAQIWADTILEGEFAADGKTQLDRIEGLFLNNELVAYRIVYSERAWNLAQCEVYDSADYSSCFEGRILEASFVDPSMKAWLRDDHSYATFY